MIRHRAYPVRSDCRFAQGAVWGTVILLAAGCDDPFNELCRTPPSTRIDAVAASPIVLPDEGRSTAPRPAPPATVPKPALPNPVPRAILDPPDLVVSLQSPAPVREPIATTPDLTTVAPTWDSVQRVAKLEPAPAPEPKPVPVTVNASRLELRSMPGKSSINGLLLAVVRLIGPDGRPVTDAEIEWSVDRAGVGVITLAGGKEEPESKQYRRSSTLARCRTSLTSYRLDRVLGSAESVTIQSGEAWCVLESHSPGDMIVVARSADIVSAENCQVHHRHHWFEAHLDKGELVEAAGGQPAQVTAQVINEKGEPLIGYPVRFEVADRADATFGATSTWVERVSDSSGRATASLKPSSDRALAARVKVQLFGRPVLPGAATFLDEKEYEVRWSPTAQADLEVDAPESAPVGTVATLTARVQSRDRGDVRGRLVAVVGTGLDVVSKLPDARDEAGLRFALAELTVAEANVRTELEVTSAKPGVRRVRFEVRDGDRLLAFREAAIRFVEATLSVEKRMPDNWQVGRQATYTVEVRNVGEIAADAVTVEDEVPAGLQIDQTDGTRFIDRIRWRIPRIEPGERVALPVLATPEQAFEPLAVRAWARVDQSPSVEAHDQLRVIGVETVEVSIDDLVDPAPLAGVAEYVVHLRNRGTSVARRVELDGQVTPHLKVLAAEGSLPVEVSGGLVRWGVVDRLGPGEHLFCRIRAQTLSVGDARLNVSARHGALGPLGIAQQESTHIYEP